MAKQKFDKALLIAIVVVVIFIANQMGWINLFAAYVYGISYMPPNWTRDTFKSEHTTVSPVIDGRINTNEWSESNHYSLTPLIEGGPGSPDNSIVMEDYYYRERKRIPNFFEVYLMHDDKYLYMGIIVYDTIANPIPDYIGAGKEGIDRLEVFWDTGLNGGSRDYQMVVNSEDSMRIDSFGAVGDHYLRGEIGVCNGTEFPIYDFSGQGLVNGIDSVDGTAAKMTFVNDHWEIEIKKAYKNPNVNTVDKSDININPVTDILGLSLYWGNNDGECHGGQTTSTCGKSFGPNGEYHAFYPFSASTLSYRYAPLLYSEPFGYLINITNWANIRFVNEKTDNIVACTADAKQCPDGSYVSRVAPNCEFAPCPINNIVCCEINNIQGCRICNPARAKCEDYDYYTSSQADMKCTLKTVSGLSCYECINIISLVPDVCCHSFGYGSGMVRCCDTYTFASVDACVIPEGFVGGGKEIVDNNYCVQQPICLGTTCINYTYLYLLIGGIIIFALIFRKKITGVIK